MNHLISSSGYECRLVGQRYDVSEGGVGPETYVGNQDFVETQVTVPLGE